MVEIAYDETFGRPTKEIPLRSRGISVGLSLVNTSCTLHDSIFDQNRAVQISDVSSGEPTLLGHDLKNGIRYRQATAADAPGIQAAIRAVYDEYDFGWFPEDYHLDLYEFDRHYTENGFPFFVAERQTPNSSDWEIVGTASLAFHPMIPFSDGETQRTVWMDDFLRICGTDCSTERLYVHPDARRLKIARTLMDILVSEAQKRGCTGMELWSDKLFEAAHSLYQNMGAEIVGERLCHDPAQSPEWGLFLPISGV